MYLPKSHSMNVTFAHSLIVSHCLLSFQDFSTTNSSFRRFMSPCDDSIAENFNTFLTKVYGFSGERDCIG